MNQLNGGARRGLRITIVILLLFSLILLGNGISGYFAALEKKVAGFPNSSTLELYVLYPGALVLVDVLLLVFLTRLPRSVAVYLVPIQILVLFIIIFYASGGI